MAQFSARTSILAGVAAGIGASVCCVGPLVLLAVGISGAWIGKLTAMEPYRPFFVGLTLLFLGLAFRKLYLRPQSCLPGTTCADDPLILKRQRVTFWVVALLLLGLLISPWIIPILYR